MPAAKNAERGESSTSAAKKAVSAAAGGNTTYELPWYMTFRLLGGILAHKLV